MKPFPKLAPAETVGQVVENSRPWPEASQALPAIRLRAGGAVLWGPQEVAEEVAVTLAYNGLTYAVMMASPDDLADFAVGFSVAERIASCAGDIRGVATRLMGDGIALDITLAPSALRRHLALSRARVRPGHAGCGLCGSADASLALSPARPILSRRQVHPAAIQAAFRHLEAAQLLNQATHAVHAAGLADPDGILRLAREDVGRHNALDKVIGAALRVDQDLSQSIGIITSRCSVEMAQKAIIAGIPVLAGISGPTALAVRTAERAGLTLIGFARGGSMSVYAGAWRVFGASAGGSGEMDEAATLQIDRHEVVR